MPTIKIKKEGNTFLVTVKEGSTQTSHHVNVPEDFYQRLTGGKVSKEDCLKASFRFLLDRESKEMILKRFDLPLISEYFPEFEREFEGYLSK